MKADTDLPPDEKDVDNVIAEQVAVGEAFMDWYAEAFRILAEN